MPVVAARTETGSRSDAPAREGAGRPRRSVLRELPPWALELAYRLERTSTGPWFRHVPLRSLALFYRLFAIMLSARLSYLSILSLMEGLTRNRNLKGILHACYVHTANGGRLSDAMAAHPWAFDALQVEMARTAEREGYLDRMLVRMADAADAEADVRRITAALWLYPRLVVILAVFALGGTFPIGGIAATALLFAGHAYSTANYVLDSLILTVLVVAVWVLATAAVRVSLYRCDSLRGRLEELLHGAPIVGPLMRQFAVAHFLRSLAAAVASGVPPAPALAAAGHATRSARLGRAAGRASIPVADGMPLWEAMHRFRLLPDDVVQTAYTAQESGEFGRLLDDQARAIEEAAEARAEIISHVFAGLVLGGTFLLIEGQILFMR